VFTVVRTIEQPLFLLFFALAGASIHLGEIPELGALGLGYVAVRLGGKLIGGFIGGLIGGLPRQDAFRLSGDLIPQAGVAVGLAVLAAEALPDSGGRVATVVLGSVVIFELAGSFLVNRSLRKVAVTEAAPEPNAAFDGVPQHVLVAARGNIDIPGWVLDSAARWGAEVTVLGQGQDNDARVERLREAARSRQVVFRWVPLRAESFSAATVRTAHDTGAQLVVVLTPPPQLGFESRLMLLPHERIARQLTCPVVLVPVEPSRLL